MLDQKIGWLHVRAPCLPRNSTWQRETPTREPIRGPYAFTRIDPVRNHVASRVHTSRSTLSVIPPPLSDVSLVQWVVLFDTTITITPLSPNREMTALTGSGGSQRALRSSHPTCRSRAVFDAVDTVLALICVPWPGAPRPMLIPSPVRCEFLRGLC